MAYIAVPIDIERETIVKHNRARNNTRILQDMYIMSGPKHMHCILDQVFGFITVYTEEGICTMKSCFCICHLAASETLVVSAEVD